MYLDLPRFILELPHLRTKGHRKIVCFSCFAFGVLDSSFSADRDSINGELSFECASPLLTLISKLWRARGKIALSLSHFLKLNTQGSLYRHRRTFLMFSSNHGNSIQSLVTKKEFLLCRNRSNIVVIAAA